MMSLNSGIYYSMREGFLNASFGAYPASRKLTENETR